MRRSRLMFVLALAGVAAVIACSSATTLPAPVSYTQPCTVGGSCSGTIPAIADAGMLLAGVDSYRLAICAPNGQTLSGAGTMLDVWGGAVIGLPVRVTGLDQTQTVSGSQCAGWPDFKVGEITAEPDFVYFVASGITVNGTDAGALTVYLFPHVER